MKYTLGKYERVEDRYVFFWKGILSQWWPTDFKARVYGDRIGALYKFCNCEQYMMFNKACLMSDYTVAEKILNEKDPKAIKSLGREVANYKEDLWSSVRLDVVVECSYQRKIQDESFAGVLAETSGKGLVEASPFDRIWGIGMEQNNKDIMDETKWKGQNLLGKALCIARDSYMSEMHIKYRNDILEYIGRYKVAHGVR